MNRKKIILCFMIVLALPNGYVFAQTQKTGFFLEPLWTASWEHEKDIINRLDLKLGIPQLGILSRIQLIDKREIPFVDNAPPPVLGTALYHTKTGSRFLYGNIDETGLSARLKNIWLHSTPLQTNHAPSSNDVSTAPSNTKEPGFFFYGGSPRLGPVRFFSSIYFEDDLKPLYIAGIDYYFSPKIWTKIEGLFIEQIIGARQPSTWFAEETWLPKRKSRLFGGSINFNHPFWGISGDFAYSETFAFGTGFYHDVSFRIGKRPWRFQAGFDIVNGAFSDREGKIPDNGMRAGMQFEAWGKAGAYFKMTGNIQGAKFGESLAKSRLAMSYYFPVPKNSFARFSRIHVNLDGNSLVQSEPGSAAKAGFGLYIGPILATSELSIHGNDEQNKNALPRFDDFKSLDALSFSEELQYRINIWTFRTKFTYSMEEKKEGKVNIFDLQLYTAAHWKWGRISGTLRFENIPENWSFSIRCSLRNKFSFGKEKQRK